jgi:hypothetical protein
MLYIFQKSFTQVERCNLWLRGDENEEKRGEAGGWLARLLVLFFSEASGNVGSRLGLGNRFSCGFADDATRASWVMRIAF